MKNVMMSEEMNVVKNVKGSDVVGNMMVMSRRSDVRKLREKYPDAVVIDVTSKSTGDWVKLSPFYPHGWIPVPGRVGCSMSVEGVWQGLKVFEHEGVDVMSFRNDKMAGLKRKATDVRGNCVGHQLGDELLGYLEARERIYVPTYEWMLENKCLDLVKRIKRLSAEKLVILLDYNTNVDVKNLAKPLSHAGLIRNYIVEKM